MIAVLGAFDGFHRGHRSLFDQARHRASQGQDDWGVITFYPHPQAVVSSGKFNYLFTEAERRILAMIFEVPRWEVLPFTRGLADMPPERFLDLLATRYTLRGIVVGSNFFFGRGRSGDIDFLRQECVRRGWSCDVVPPMKQDGQTVSSTAIRRAILEGHVAAAKALLGYPFGVLALVVPGDRRGRGLGFPTANLSCPPGKLLPPGGVYAAAVVVEGGVYPGAANVGYNPTFAGQRSLRCEVFIVGFSKDIYGKTLGAFFLERLRDERRFHSASELVTQLSRDRDRAAEVFYRHAGEQEIFSFFRSVADVMPPSHLVPLSDGRDLC